MPKTSDVLFAILRRKVRDDVTYFLKKVRKMAKKST